MEYQWSNVGRSPVYGARRNGASWNEFENADLKSEFVELISGPKGLDCRQACIKLSIMHERLLNAIEIRLCKLFRVDDVDKAYRIVKKMHVTPVRTEQANSWASADGRVTKVSMLDLDHAINIVNDCTFRVAVMRRAAVNALGSLDNANLSKPTVDAFTTVRPTDVFTALPAIRDHARRLFQDRFGVSLTDIAKVINVAWEHGTPIASVFAEGVKFYLHEGISHKPARLLKYLVAMKITTDAEYRAMCWNLRIDQPVAWAMIARDEPGHMPLHRLIKQIPMLRRNSALRFDAPVFSYADDTDIPMEALYWRK